MTIARLHAGPRMSQAVIHGSTIYLAGQVADQAKGKSVSDQTKEILATIDRLLAEAGSDKTKILSATIYLADIATFAEMNAVWDAWVLGRPCASARDRRGQARRAGLYRRDRLHRRNELSCQALWLAPGRRPELILRGDPFRCLSRRSTTLGNRSSGWRRPKKRSTGWFACTMKRPRPCAARSSAFLRTASRHRRRRAPCFAIRNSA